MKLVIIGSGNVANVLGLKFQSAGHRIIQVVGRNPVTVTMLAGQLNAEPCHDMQEMTREADVFIFATGDESLYQLNSLQLSLNGLVVHTAGAVPSEVLGGLSASFGVLYPLQTLSRSELAVSEIPFLVTGNTTAASEKIFALASSVSRQVAFMEDSRRARIHLAATIVNNFSNHLFALAYDFCDKEEVNFSLLMPLISQTVTLAATHDPSRLQTGPAARRDFVTIEKHQEMLMGYPHLQKLYKEMTESIMALQEAQNL